MSGTVWGIEVGGLIIAVLIIVPAPVFKETPCRCFEPAGSRF
jgi:hypothetical protein